MASIKKRNSGWQARLRVNKNGKLISISKQGFRTKKEATIWANKQEVKDYNGETVLESDQSLPDYFINWFHLYKEDSLRSATKRRYKETYRVLINYWGKTPLKDITYDKYQIFLKSFGQDHAKATVSKIHSQTRASIRAALRTGKIARDFTEEATVYGKPGKTEEEKYLEADDMIKLLDYCRKDLRISTVTKIMITTALYTGLRIEEVGALTWDKVDFKHKRLQVTRAWDYANRGGFMPTKNESSIRTIDINDDLIDQLTKWKEIQTDYFLEHHKQNRFDLVQHRSPHADKNEPDPTNLIFLNDRQNIVGSDGTRMLLMRLSKKVKDGGLGIKRVTFHGLRHTHASYLIAQGVSVYYISKRMGHASVSVTLDTYSHLLRSLSDEESNKTTQVLDNIFGSNQSENKLKKEKCVT